MVNAAMARRPRRVKFNKKSVKSDDATIDPADSDVGGGVSLLDSSPVPNHSSLHTKIEESPRRFTPKDAKIEVAPAVVKVEDVNNTVEPFVKLDPTSSPFKPVQATTNGHSNGIAQPALQELPQFAQAPQQANYGVGQGQAQQFTLPPSVADMIQANDQNVGQTHLVGGYPNSNGISNSINQNGHILPGNKFVQIPQQPVDGQLYAVNGAMPVDGSFAVQPIQQMSANQQQFTGAQGNQQQSLYAQIQAQKQVYQQANGGYSYQQVGQTAPAMAPYTNVYPQAQPMPQLQYGVHSMNPQYNGLGVPGQIGQVAQMGLPPSASYNNVVTSPTNPSSEGEFQEVVATEPRNFAPRNPEPVNTGPPPQFAIPATPLPLAYQAQVPQQLSLPYNGQAHNGSSDPFTVAPIHGGIQPLHPTAVQPSNALAVYSNPVPDHIKAARSAQLNNITSGPTGRPSLEVALDPRNFPFIESSRLAAAANHGVVKLKNIPFATKRSEILAFLGRNSKVLNDNQEPVHIIMERVTSKTNDAYVEFMNMQAAINAVEKHQKTISSGRLSRLGDRPIDVELSSQAALMEDLFPLAQGVKWHGASPELLHDHPTEPWMRFKGFITDEEMTMLVKHVEVPQRSPFSRDCPQRPFECMISTIKKLPWFMTNLITVRQRHAVFKAALDLIRLLSQAIHDNKNSEYLTQQLLRRLYTAAMLCPGFSASQKDDISYMLNLSEQQEREFNQPRFAHCWTHIYTMAPKPGIPLDVLEWYIAVIREETMRMVNSYPLNVRSQLQKLGSSTGDYWGYFWHELSLPSGPDFDSMTLGCVSTLEFQAIDRILRRAFGQ